VKFLNLLLLIPFAGGMVFFLPVAMGREKTVDMVTEETAIWQINVKHTYRQSLDAR
jgi:hypothetical protein